MTSSPKTPKVMTPKITRDQTQLFLDLLHQLAKVDPEFPLHYSICLARIAMNEGLSLTQLADLTGLALSTVSRIVGALSDYRPNGQAYGLIELKVSVQERRRKELYLTPKGWGVMRGIGAVLDAYSSNPSPEVTDGQGTGRASGAGIQKSSRSRKK